MYNLNFSRRTDIFEMILNARIAIKMDMKLKIALNQENVNFVYA